MKKLFISQPMKGKSHEDILAERDSAIASAKEVLCDDIEILDSYFKDYNPTNKRIPLIHLAKSIEVLADADILYLATGWREARGCNIEYMCALKYGIPFIDGEKLNGECE